MRKLFVFLFVLGLAFSSPVLSDSLVDDDIMDTHNFFGYSKVGPHGVDSTQTCPQFEYTALILNEDGPERGYYSYKVNGVSQNSDIIQKNNYGEIRMDYSGLVISNPNDKVTDFKLIPLNYEYSSETGYCTLKSPHFGTSESVSFYCLPADNSDNSDIKCCSPDLNLNVFEIYSNKNYLCADTRFISETKWNSNLDTPFKIDRLFDFATESETTACSTSYSSCEDKCEKDDTDCTAAEKVICDDVYDVCNYAASCTLVSDACQYLEIGVCVSSTEECEEVMSDCYHEIQNCGDDKTCLGAIDCTDIETECGDVDESCNTNIITPCKNAMGVCSEEKQECDEKTQECDDKENECENTLAECSQSCLTVRTTCRSDELSPHDILATNYAGAQNYGWLVCQDDDFSAAGNANAGTNLVSSIAVDNIISGAHNGLTSYGELSGTVPDTETIGGSTNGFEGLDLTSFIQDVNAITQADSVAADDTVSNSVYYSDDFKLSLTEVKDLFSDDSGFTSGNENFELYLKPVLLNDGATEFLLAGSNFPEGDYVQIGIQGPDDDNEIYNSLSFRKPGSVANDFFMLSDIGDYFMIQSEDDTTLDDEAGILKPVYVKYFELGSDDALGSSFDIIIKICSQSDLNDCTDYTFENVLRVGRVAEWQDTDLIESYLCSDSKIYECTGPSYYAMNVDFTNTDVPYNWSENDFYFSRLRRTSQMVDLIYDPDYQYFSPESFGNVIIYDTEIELDRRLIAPQDTNKFLFKDSLDGYDYFSFDFFTYYPLERDLEICIRDENCCYNISKDDVIPRMFDNFIVQTDSNVTECDDDYSIDNIFINTKSSSSRPLIFKGETVGNIFALDRFYVVDESENSYFCGSDRKWHTDFDYDAWACENTPGMYWAGGAEDNEANPQSTHDLNQNCCGDDYGETWESQNGDGACYNSTFVFNDKRVLDSYRISDLEVYDDSEHLLKTQLLVKNGMIYGCNINGIEVSDLNFTLNAGDVIDSPPIINSKQTKFSSDSNSISSDSLVKFRGDLFRKNSPNSDNKCDLLGNYYCSPNEGWRKDFAFDEIQISSYERSHYSNISFDINSATLANIFLLDGNSDKNLSKRGIENYNKPYLDGCCPENWCWNGYQCIENQRDEPGDWLRLFKGDDLNDLDGEYYRCIDGNWTITPEFKKTWQTSQDEPNTEQDIRDFISFPDGLTTGFCPRETDCLVNPDADYNYSFDYLDDQEFLNNYVSSKITLSSKFYDFTRLADIQCIPKGYYIGNYYCDGGNWSTRTQIMARNLTKFAKENSVQAYTLYCDIFNKVFNLQGMTQLGQEHYNDLGCVLNYEDNNQNVTIYAVELNTHNLKNIGDLGLEYTDDILVPYDGKNATSYGSNNYKNSYLYFDNTSDILYFSKNGEIPIQFSQQNIINKIWNFIKTLFSNKNEFNNLFDGVSEQFYIYDKLYVLNSSKLQAFAITGYVNGDIYTRAYYQNKTDIDLAEQFRKMNETESKVNSAYSLDLFNHDKSLLSLGSESGDFIKIEHNFTDAFNPGNTFYEEHVNSDNSLWAALVDDLMVQIRVD